VGNPAKEPFGYVPDHFHPDSTIVASFVHALVACWDLKGSTKQVLSEPSREDPFWEAQSDVMVQLLGMLRPKGFEPDLALPTGDGFLLIFDLARFKNPLEEGQKKMLLVARPIIDAFVDFQDRRAENRPRTDKWGVARFPEAGLTICGSNKLDGRFGMAKGMVTVHKCPSKWPGGWVSAVGEPLFKAARLCGAAPDYGGLVDDELLPDGVPGNGIMPRRLHATKESVELNGFSEPVVVWHFAPKG
jgi:hypothetical protein